MIEILSGFLFGILLGVLIAVLPLLWVMNMHSQTELRKIKSKKEDDVNNEDVSNNSSYYEGDFVSPPTKQED